MPDPAIQVDALTKRFDGVAAVDDVSFAVHQGSVTGLLGGNGAGKTTTLAMLLGLLLPTSGAVTVLGEDMVANRFRVLPRINFSSPYFDLPLRLTVRQNLAVYARLYGIRKIRARVLELAEMFGLERMIDRPYGQLSAGERTRVALARSLLNEPELLLLDEPTASLDPDSADYMRSHLVDYQRRTGATILLASHNMLEVERICRDVLVMRRGRIVVQGTPAELIDRYGRRNMEEVFLDIARGPDRVASWS